MNVPSDGVVRITINQRIFSQEPAAMLITAGVENVLYSTNHPTSALILDNNFLRVIKRVTVSGITELVCEHVYLAGQGYRPVHPGILKKNYL